MKKYLISSTSAVAFVLVAASSVFAADAQLTQNLNTSLDANIQGVVKTTVNTTASTSVNANIGSGTAGAVNTTNATTTASMNTDTDADVNGNTSSTDDVSIVNSDASHVEVAYKVPSKFLGIFSSNIYATADVSFKGSNNENASDKQVIVKYPWYRIFYSLDSKAKASTMEEAIGANLNNNVDVSAEASVRNGKAAQAIRNALKGIRAGTSASAEVSTY